MYGHYISPAFYVEFRHDILILITTSNMRITTSKKIPFKRVFIIIRNKNSETGWIYTFSPGGSFKNTFSRWIMTCDESKQRTLARWFKTILQQQQQQIAWPISEIFMSVICLQFVRQSSLKPFFCLLSVCSLSVIHLSDVFLSVICLQFVSQSSVW